VGLLRFLRLPGAFTAAADVLAGFFIIRFSGLDYERIGYFPNILAASICFYLAGMAWNDLFDVDEDSALRPERPLPSGQISMTNGFFTAVILSIAGLMLSMTAGMATFIVGAVLLLLIFLYNALLKNIPLLGPIAMGGCRGGNLFFGMCAHTYILLLLGDPRVYLPPVITFCYIVVVTALSEMESNDTRTVSKNDFINDVELSTEIDLSGLGEVDLNNPIEARHHNDMRRKYDLHVVLSQNKITTPAMMNNKYPVVEPEPLLLYISSALLIAVPLVAGFMLSFNWLGWVITAGLFSYLGHPIYMMITKNSGINVKKVVGAGISGICILDAALVSAAVAFHPNSEVIGVCAIIAGMIIPAVILRKYISLT